MATVDDLFTEIRPLAPGVPVLTLRRAIRQAHKRFCIESYAWRKVLASFELQASTIEQDLEAALPEGSGIYAIAEDPSRVSDGSRISRSSPAELNRLMPNWRNTTDGSPTYCFLSSPTTISFVKAPTSALEVDIPVILMPLQGSNTIDDYLLENYYDGLSFGALAIALNMPQQPWYDPQTVAGYSALFAQAVDKAKEHSMQQLTPQATGMSYGGI